MYEYRIKLKNRLFVPFYLHWLDELRPFLPDKEKQLRAQRTMSDSCALTNQRAGSLQEALYGFTTCTSSFSEPQTSNRNAHTETTEQVEIYLIRRTVRANSDGLRRIQLHQKRTLRSQHTLCGKSEFNAVRTTETYREMLLRVTSLKWQQVSSVLSETATQKCAACLLVWHEKKHKTDK